MRPEGALFEQLVALGVVEPSRVRLFADGTRDVPGLPVWRDEVSRVVFISGHYVGDTVYQSGSYRAPPAREPSPLGQDFEDHEDTQRRLGAYRTHYHGRHIADFGCGAGSFLAGARAVAASVCGIELQQDSAERLRAAGIPCHAALDANAGTFDAVFAFHALEHLPDPLQVLRQVRSALRPGGRLVVEVPHARDLLLDQLDVAAFRRFTLWSQHLVLHTRQSLAALLAAAGFGQVLVEGVQRYPLANHLHWLRHGKPGGHRQVLAMLDTPGLRHEYAAALARIDATDTLVAIASVPD